MNDFRPCPHCEGGGYLTWVCVEERRLSSRSRAVAAGVLAGALLCAVGACGLVAHVALKAENRAWAGALSLMLLSAAAHGLAVLARASASAADADAPLQVACPECHSDFVLAAADATADAAAAHRGRGGGVPQARGLA